MVWVFLALGLLWLMLAFPKFGGVVLGCAVLFGIGLYVQDERQSNESARKQREARSVERLKILSLGDANLALDGVLSRVSGTVTNTSSSDSVTYFTVDVRVYDCPDRSAPGVKCTVVGEESETFYVDLPPGQKRAFDQAVSFSGLPKLIPAQWSWAAILREVHVR